MRLKDYQKFTPSTFVGRGKFRDDLAHIQSGVFAEAGEVAGCYQKYYRRDYTEVELKKRLSKEIGGLMYYLSMLCNYEGLDLEQVIEENATILKDRQKRGVLQGDGDDR